MAGHSLSHISSTLHTTYQITRLIHYFTFCTYLLNSTTYYSTTLLHYNTTLHYTTHIFHTLHNRLIHSYTTTHIIYSYLYNILNYYTAPLQNLTEFLKAGDAGTHAPAYLYNKYRFSPVTPHLSVTLSELLLTQKWKISRVPRACLCKVFRTGLKCWI